MSAGLSQHTARPRFLLRRHMQRQHDAGLSNGRVGILHHRRPRALASASTHNPHGPDQCADIRAHARGGDNDEHGGRHLGGDCPAYQRKQQPQGGCARHRADVPALGIRIRQAVSPKRIAGMLPCRIDIERMDVVFGKPFLE
ncbi:hypothetical protein D3C72_1696690 [compost metagenome]